MLIEILIILILFILFHCLLNVRSTLKLLIVTILLFLTCSILLMLKGFIIISCVFILVYAGAILVMICIAFVLSPIIVETTKNKTKNELETIYFEISTEVIQYICGGFIIAISILIWWTTLNPLIFWDIINNIFCISSENIRSLDKNFYLEKKDLYNYTYYLDILNYYNINNYDLFKNYYDNNYNYYIQIYLNNLRINDEENLYFFKKILIKEILTEIRILRILDQLIIKGTQAYNQKGYIRFENPKVEYFCRYYLEQNKELSIIYLKNNSSITANGFLFHYFNFKEQCGISTFKNQFNNFLQNKIIKEVETFNVIPKELLFCNLSINFIKEILQNILYIDYKLLGNKNFMKDIKLYYNKQLYLDLLHKNYSILFEKIITRQINLELEIINIKNIYNTQIFNFTNQNKISELFEFNDIVINLFIKNENLETNQVINIYKYSKYIIVLVGLYLHFTLLVCLRIFTINQQLINIKRQDSNDQILKKWKK